METESPVLHLNDKRAMDGSLPEEMFYWERVYWNSGRRIHLHCNQQVDSEWSMTTSFDTTQSMINVSMFSSDWYYKVFLF